MSAIADVFVSYCREDIEDARRFVDLLVAAGLSVWWDQNLKAGTDFTRITEAELTSAAVTLVLWSPRSVESDWVRSEAACALEQGTLLPCKIELCVVPLRFRSVQTADLSGWDGSSEDANWNNFLDAIRAQVEDKSRDEPQAAAPPPKPEPKAASAQPLVVNLSPHREIAKQAAVAVRLGLTGIPEGRIRSELSAAWDEVEALVALEADTTNRPTMQSCGRFLEGLLKSFLKHELHHTPRPTATFGQNLTLLVHLAKENFEGQNTTSILQSALILRNWVSHYDAKSGRPKDRDVAQAVALCAVVLNHLYPRERGKLATIDSAEYPELANLTANNGLGAAIQNLNALPIEQCRSVLTRNNNALLRQCMVVGSGKSVSNLDAVIKQDPVLAPLFVSELRENFGFILLNWRTMSARVTIRFLMLLKRRGLKPLAETFAILLPIDADLMTAFIREHSLAFCAVYVSECQKFNSRAFNLYFDGRSDSSKSRIKMVSDALVSRLSANSDTKYEGSIINTANLLASLPAPIQQRVLMGVQPERLARWIIASPVSDSTGFLVPLNNPVAQGRQYVAGHLTSKIVSAMCQAIAVASDDELQKLPRRIAIILRKPYRFDISPLVRGWLDRANQAMGVRDLRRLLWDSFVYFPEFADEVDPILLTRLTSGRSEGSLDDLSLLGVAVCRGHAFDLAKLQSYFGHQFILTEPDFAEVDRWRLFLALLGYWAIKQAGLEVVSKRGAEAKLAIRTRALVAETVGGDAISQDLLTKVKSALETMNPA